MTLATVDLSRDDYDAYYLGYSNGVLWPVFHYRLDLADFDAGGNLNAYRRVNQLFARKLRTAAEAGRRDLDPRLPPDPLAAELRAIGCSQRIGFFLHIPLPPPLILAAIPQHEWLMRALFAYDLLGFQSQADLDHFSRYVQGEASAEPMGEYRFRAFHRTVRAQAFPIGIDVDEFVELGRGDEARETYEMMRHQYARRRLLLGIDRLDYSKGCRSGSRRSRFCWRSTPRTAPAPR